jgi:hypothetical protein
MNQSIQVLKFTVREDQYGGGDKLDQTNSDNVFWMIYTPEICY